MSRCGVAVALVGALGVTPGCWFFGGGGDGPPADVAAIAVGAEVTLEFEEGCSDDLLSVCLVRAADTVDGVRMSGDAFESVTQRVDDNGRVLVTVRALEVGEAGLTLDYVDRYGDDRSVSVRLQALAITHVDLWVFCASGPVEPGVAYPISAGGQFSFATAAMADETPLASGQLPLVEDLAGFAVSDDVPGSYPRATAPAGPGTYTWILGGLEPRTVDFAVYQPGALAVELAELAPGNDPWSPRIAVSGAVAGVPVCIHDAETRVRVTAVAGTCAPLMSGFEIEGPLPMLLDEGRVELALAGQGDCTIEAALDTGSPVELTVAVDNLMPPPVAGEGLALAPAAIEVGGAQPVEGTCDDEVTDGDCDLDGDCLVDSDWVITHHDGTDSSEDLIEDGQAIGVGLTSELHLMVELDFLTIGVAEGPPVDLEVSVSPAGPGLGFESPGCRSDDSRILLLNPTAAGSYDLTLQASNIDDVAGFGVQALAVTSALFSTSEAEDEAAGAADVFYFVGSATDIAVGYRALGTTVRGVAPIQVSASDAAAGSTISDDGTELATGTVPHDITLASPLASQTQIVRVVDEGTILGVGDFTAETVYTGLSQCLEPYPTTGGGRRIHGEIPVRPRLSLSGDALTVETSPWVDGRICLRGQTAGSTVVQVSWGAGSAQQTWVVDDL